MVGQNKPPKWAKPSCQTQLGDAEGKPVKSIHIYQDDEALNVDLEFDDDWMLEMIFRVGFRSTINLLENRGGDYHIRKRIKPRRSTE
jgi:hypothetical protein